MQAQKEMDILTPRIQAIKTDIMNKMEERLITTDTLTEYHAMMIVCRQLMDGLKQEINNGKVAEKELGAYGDV